MTFAVDGIDHFTIEAQEIGRPFEVYVTIFPAEGDELVPAIYLADADMFFLAVSQMTGLLKIGGDIPPVCVIGVGYPVGNILTDPEQFGLMMEHRQHDLSPVVDADFYRWTGGGPAFLAFLRAELIPLIESRYPVSDQGRTILGHSLGADFAVQAVLAEDSPFARCVAGSPAIFRMLEQEQVPAAVDRIAASGDEFPRKIYLGCGSLEGAGDHPGLDRDLSGHVWSSALSYGRSKHRGSG